MKIYFTIEEHWPVYSYSKEPDTHSKNFDIEVPDDLWQLYIRVAFDYYKIRNQLNDLVSEKYKEDPSVPKG